MPSKALIVDANILVRAVLGKRVRAVIEAYAEDVSFFVPEVAFAEAEEHLPALVIKRGNDPGKALAFLHTLGRLLEVIGSDVYGEFEADSPGTARPTGSGGLAGSGSRVGAWLPHLDRGYRFFRMRCCHMDLQQRADVSAWQSEVAGDAEATNRIGTLYRCAIPAVLRSGGKPK